MVQKSYFKKIFSNIFKLQFLINVVIKAAQAGKHGKRVSWSDG